MFKCFVWLILFSEGYSRGLIDIHDKRWKKQLHVEPKYTIDDQAVTSVDECTGCGLNSQLEGETRLNLQSKSPERTVTFSKVTATQPPRRKTRPFLMFHRISVKVNSLESEAEEPDSIITTTSKNDSNSDMLTEQKPAFVRLNVQKHLNKDEQTVETMSYDILKTSNIRINYLEGNNKSAADDNHMQTDTHSSTSESLNTVIYDNFKKSGKYLKGDLFQFSKENRKLQKDGNKKNARLHESLISTASSAVDLSHKGIVSANYEKLISEYIVQGSDGEIVTGLNTEKVEQKTEQLHDTTSNVDRILQENDEDRWSRKDLKQVPDVARLERRLHPTVNAPVNDIIESMKNMLVFLQRRLQRVEEDYDGIHNTTRWTYMMGVRVQLSELAEENDRIYSVVMESSLLTKEIYRKSHEHTHKAVKVEATEIAYQSEMLKARETVLPSRACVIAQAALDDAQELKQKIVARISQRDALYLDMQRIHHTVRDKLPLTVMDDLYRRADQTVGLISSSQPQSKSEDKIRLYSHMTNNTYSTMRRAKELIREATDMLTHISSNFMKAKQKLHEDNKRLQRNKLLTDLTYNDRRLEHFVLVDTINHHASLLSDRAAFIHMKLHDLIVEGRRLISDTAQVKFERRLEMSIQQLKLIVKKLISTLDSIRLLIGDASILGKRCDELDGSGWFTDDEHSPVIDCQPYIIDLLESSGDDTEGSGEPEVSVDMDKTSSKQTDKQTYTSSVDIDLAELTDNPDRTGGEIIFIDEDTDNEDIIQVKTTKRLPVPTTPATSESASTVAPNDNKTETTDETEDGFEFTDLFGWFNDAPDKVDIGDGLPASVGNLLNDMILERLYNYSQGSKTLLEKAKKTHTSMQDLSLTWNKASSQFVDVAQFSKQARSAITTWRAEQPFFVTVHDMVHSVDQSITLTGETVNSQCVKAVDVADRKLKTMTEAYKAEKEKTQTAPDPTLVSEAINYVAVVKNGVGSISRLKKFYPDPCSILDNYNKRIRANISELRQKIERAKLIASSLQVAVSVESNDYIELPISRELSLEHPVTSTFQLALRHTGSNGQLMSVQMGKDDSLSVELANDDVEVKHSVGGAVKTTPLSSEDNSDKWYILLLERFASVYNVSVVTEGGVSSTVAVDMASPRVDLLPTSLRIGGSKHLSVCMLSVTINGQSVNLLGRNLTRIATVKPCLSQGRLTSHPHHMLLDGSGYAVFGLSDILHARRVDKLVLAFNPKSDGLVLHLDTRTLNVEVTAEVDDGILRLYVRFIDYETYLQTVARVYSSDQTVEISFIEGKVKNVQVLLNGRSDVFKTATGDHKKIDAKPEQVFIGGFEGDMRNRSLVGCIKLISLNNNEVLFLNILKAKGIRFGTCRVEECVRFDENSSPIVLTNLSYAKKIHTAVKRESLGPVLQFSKHTQKFDLTVSLDTEGLFGVERIKDTTERIPIKGESKYIFLSVVDDADKESVTVIADGVSKTFSYTSGGGAWWGGNKKKDTIPTTYGLSIGASENSDVQYIGTIQDFLLDGRPIALLQKIDTHGLNRCIIDPVRSREISKTKRKVDRECG